MREVGPAGGSPTRPKCIATRCQIIAPITQRGHWYFALDGVKPEKIVLFEQWDGKDYAPLDAESLVQLVERIEEEKRRIGYRQIDHQRCDFDITDSWSLDGISLMSAR